MLLTTTNNNLFDTFFSDPWFNDPWFDDRDVQKAQKKLYGHNGKRGRGQEVYLQRALLRKLSENLLCG